MTTTAIVCATVFAGSILVSWRLARLLKDCDARDAAMYAVVEAERIAFDEFQRVWGI